MTVQERHSVSSRDSVLLHFCAFWSDSWLPGLPGDYTPVTCPVPCPALPCPGIPCLVPCPVLHHHEAHSTLNGTAGNHRLARSTAARPGLPDGLIFHRGRYPGRGIGPKDCALKRESGPGKTQEARKPRIDPQVYSPPNDRLFFPGPVFSRVGDSC